MENFIIPGLDPKTSFEISSKPKNLNVDKSSLNEAADRFEEAVSDVLEAKIMKDRVMHVGDKLPQMVTKLLDKWVKAIYRQEKVSILDRYGFNFSNGAFLP